MVKLKYDGLLKLIEECAELGQISAKAIAYWGDNIYPDGTDIHKNMIEETGDVLAVIEYVIKEKDLIKAVQERKELKLAEFDAWQKEDWLGVCKNEKELFDRKDPNCEGEIIPDIRGGIICKKCDAWR